MKKIYTPIYHTSSSHLISTETGNAAETSCKNKSKFFVNTALQVYPWDLISPLVRGRSSVTVAREAGRSWILQENDTTISSFSSTCSITISCRRIYSTTQCLLSITNKTNKHYSGIPLYGRPLNTDTPILETISFVPSKSSYCLHKINPLISYCNFSPWTLSY